MGVEGIGVDDQGKEHGGSEGREETGRRRETTDTGLLKLLQNELLYLSSQVRWFPAYWKIPTFMD